MNSLVLPVWKRTSLVSKGCFLCCATYQTAYKNLLFKVRLRRISWSWIPYLNHLQNYARKISQVILGTSPVKENLEHILVETGFSCPSKILRLFSIRLQHILWFFLNLHQMHLNHRVYVLLFLILALHFPENPSQGFGLETRDRGAEKELKTQSMEAPLTISPHVEAGLFARRVSTLPKLLSFTFISMCSFHRKRCLAVKSNNPATGVQFVGIYRITGVNWLPQMKQ